MKNALILQHARQEGAGLFEGILAERKNWRAKTIRLYEDKSLPVSPAQFDMILIMGGPMNVDQTEIYPFLKPELEFMEKGLELQVPMLGICLGAQLIAKAAGACVYRGHEREIGWYNVQLTSHGKQDPCFCEFDSDFSVFQWHEDTFNLPPRALPLVTSATYPNQAFRLGSAYGLQFHLEVTLPMIAQWFEFAGDFADTKIEPKAIMKSALTLMPCVHSMARVFFERFTDSI